MNNNHIIRIIDLQNRLEDLEVDVEDLQKKVAELKRQHEEDVGKLNKRVDEIESKYTLAKETLPVEQVAKMLFLSVDTVYKLARAGKIPCSRPNDGKLIFKAQEILDWIDNNPSKTEIKRQKIKKAEEWRNSHPKK